MNKHLLILLATFIFQTHSFTQTISEAKDFLKQQLELNPASDKYSQFSLFADELPKKDLQSFINKEFDTSLYSQIFIQFETLSMNGKTVKSKTNAFDIAGIKNIQITSVDFYTQITIYIKDGFKNVFTENNALKSTVDIRKLSRAVFFIKRNESLAERIEKSLYFLCKQYGGSPIEKSAF